MIDHGQAKTVFRKPTPSANSLTANIENSVENAVKNTSENVVNDQTVFAPRATPKNQAEAEQDKTVIAHTKEPQSQDAQVKLLKNRFVLEDVLGVGGMGVVYKAKDLLKVEAKDRDPYVAIKVLSDEFKTHPEAFISLQRESKKAQHIANHNTVKVYDFDRDGDVVFMTME